MMLSLKNVAKSFGGVKAVDGCTFDVKKNTITSIIGPNGAGKTTLFNIISGLTKSDFGSIGLLGIELSKLKPYRIAQLGISRTFQTAKVFKNLSIKDNMLVARKTSDSEINGILESVFLSKPLETIASELSYGQQRLLEIARALLMPHKLLMLDEPTAGVNQKVRNELRSILIRLKKEGKTVLLIEHDMSFVMDVSDFIVVLNEGKVLKIGRPKDIIKDKKVLEAYLGK